MQDAIPWNDATRFWSETVIGLAWTEDKEDLTFDQALNAYLGALHTEGASVWRIDYTALPGPDGQVIHSALVTYISTTQVDYVRAIERLYDDRADREAAESFIAEDLHEALAGQLPEEEEDEDAAELS